jgi:hypothetical protein
MAVFTPRQGASRSIAIAELSLRSLSIDSSNVFSVGDDLASVVPDGVARVRWTFSRERLPNRADPKSGFVLPGGVVTADVVGNIAAAEAISRSVVNPSSVTWLNAAGRPIGTSHSRQAQPAKAAAAGRRTRSPRA